MQHLLSWLRAAGTQKNVLKCTFDNGGEVGKEPQTIKRIEAACKDEYEQHPPYNMKPQVLTEPRTESPDESRPGSFFFVTAGAGRSKVRRVVHSSPAKAGGVSLLSSQDRNNVVHSDLIRRKASAAVYAAVQTVFVRPVHGKEDPPVIS